MILGIINQNIKEEATGSSYFVLSMLAFAGLGLEMIPAFLIEPFIFGAQMKEWSAGQNIAYWVIICIVWGICGSLPIWSAKNKYDFNIFKKQKKMKLWQWLTAGACIVFSLVMSYLDWNGFKVIKEFENNDWPKFIFQYIYYIFETGLFTLIIIFGQKACEKWFKKENYLTAE